MITPKWQDNLEVAESYFFEHIGPAHYYGAGSLFPGEWLGRGSSMLGLTGPIDELGFHRLCRNLHPQTGHKLTERQKADRRIFCDFVLSPPKSFSVLALVGGDRRLVDLHRHAARLAVEELEKLAMCRIRGNGQDCDIDTGNVIGARFTDPTSREHDPHLHDHCALFNATWDAKSQTWKALQNSEMLRGQKFVESLYYHILVQGLIKLGYEVRSIPGQNDFQIVGIDRSISDKFSKRHLQIQESAQKLERSKGGNIKDHAEMLAHHQREPKQKDVTQAQLLARWHSQLTADERKQIESLVQKTQGLHPGFLLVMSPSAAVSWALRHVLERRAVVRDHEVLRHALDHARGSNVPLEQLRAAFAERRDVLRVGRSITTVEVLQIETTLLDLAAQGKGRYSPINPSWKNESGLNAEQKIALHGILSSSNEHAIVRGAAGTGKSTLLKQVCRAVAATSVPIVVLAPQAQQVRGLAADGLPSPLTLAAALKAGKLPEKAVVICDEAGQIGSVSLLELFRLCRRHSCQLILSGDTRQHGPVERGDALRSLEKYAQVETFSLEQNQRQNPANAQSYTESKRIETYRASVQAVAQGDVARSLNLLDQIGGIHEVTGDKLQVMAREYVTYAKDGESILAVSQTRAEVGQLNDAIRQALQKEAQIGSDQWEGTALISRDFTEAEKQDPRSYTDCPKLVLHTNVGNWKAGKVLEVMKTTEAGVMVGARSEEKLIPWSESTKWQVCQPHTLKLAQGERLQLKRNQRAVKDKDALVNGEIVEISHLLQDGTIRLKDGRSLPPEYRTFQLGYATTSYGGQGKTVDHVLVSDSGIKAATNARQWYVDISRGRKSATIFTSDKSGLIQRICQHGQNPLALEVFPPLAPKVPRAGQRARLVLKELAAQWLGRSRRFVRRCCHHMQVLRIMEFTKQQTFARRVTPCVPGRTR
jgi:conjugative relaxase-like TrwC/TraI family protein